MSSYDSNNIFARILRSEVPCQKITETSHTLAFHDAFPKAKIHALVIPKGAYQNLNEFCKNASTEELEDFWRTVEGVSTSIGIADDGFRMISNAGLNGGQEVPHFHIHLVGGQELGAMISVSKAP